MPSVAEYRQYAAECLMWARQAKTDFERELFLKMAHDRLHAATLFEALFHPAPSFGFRRGTAGTGSSNSTGGVNFQGVRRCFISSTTAAIS